MLRHSAIKDCEQTCLASPEQYEGLLRDGRTFYFRYRSGRAQLGVGANLYEAVGATFCPTPPSGAETYVGDRLQGVFNSAAQRDRVFADLFAALEAVEE